MVLGYAPTALAATQLHVKLSTSDHVNKVEATLSGRPAPWYCAREGGSNNYKYTKGDQFISDDVLYIEVFFDNGTSQKYHHPGQGGPLPHFKLGHESGGTLNIDITNVVPPSTTGTVTVTKAKAGDSDDFPTNPSTFTVTLTGPETHSSTALALGEGGRVTFENVAPGTYTVAEAHPGDNWGIPVYSVGDQLTNELTVEAGGTCGITITNSYDTPQGKLKVYHKVDGTGESLAGPFTYEGDVGHLAEVWALTFSGYQLKPGEVSKYEYTYTDGATHEYTFWYVPSTTPQGILTVYHKVVGTEEPLETEKFIQDVGSSITVNALEFPDFKLKEGEAESLTHTFTNESHIHTFWYVMKPATIRVIKTVYDVPEGFDCDTEFSVTVAGTNEGNTYCETKSVKDGEDKYVEFEVPPGSYSVTETPVDGWFCAAARLVNAAAGQVQIVRLPNHYLYSLTVIKVVDQEAGTYDPNQEFTIEVTPVPLNPTLAPQALGEPPTASLKAGQSATFDGLRAGSYTVTEVTDGLPDGWECLTPEQTVVLGSGSATETCTVENKYTAPDPELGRLKVTKELSPGSDPYEGEQTFKIGIAPVLQVSSVNGDEEDWPRYVYLGIDDSDTFTELPPGEYVVFEVVDVEQGFPANWVCDSEPQFVEVEAGETVECTIYNRYTAPVSQQYTLTLFYKRWDTKATIKDPISHTENKDEFREYPAPSISGYHLDTARSPSPFSFTFTKDDAHTFWYLPNETPPPPPPDTSLLTVYYKEWGTDDAVHAPTTHSGYVGTSQVINAFAVEGYELREGTDASYTHKFTSGNATHTFWYEMIIPDEPPPLAGTGGISAPTMYGIGISLLGLGLATKKRRRK